MAFVAFLVRWPLGILQFSTSPSKNGGANNYEMSNLQSTQLQPASPLTGTNIYGQIILLIASLFGGMSQDTAGLVVSAVSTIIAAVFGIRNWIVTAKFSLNKSWIKDPNNWTYVTAVVTGLLPALAGLVPQLQSLAVAIVNKSLAEILTVGFSLFSFIYYRWIKK